MKNQEQALSDVVVGEATRLARNFRFDSSIPVLPPSSPSMLQSKKYQGKVGGGQNLSIVMVNLLSCEYGASSLAV